MMALLLLPVFLVSLACTISGCRHAVDTGKTVVIASLGLVVMALTFPVVMVVANSVSGGFLEKRVEPLWSFVKLLTIGEGDIYMGAGALLLLMVSSVLVALQLWLVRTDTQE